MHLVIQYNLSFNYTASVDIYGLKFIILLFCEFKWVVITCKPISSVFRKAFELSVQWDGHSSAGLAAAPTHVPCLSSPLPLQNLRAQASLHGSFSSTTLTAVASQWNLSLRCRISAWWRLCVCVHVETKHTFIYPFFFFPTVLQRVIARIRSRLAFHGYIGYKCLKRVAHYNWDSMPEVKQWQSTVICMDICFNKKILYCQCIFREDRYEHSVRIIIHGQNVDTSV